MRAGLKVGRAVARGAGWNTIISAMDPQRGYKMVTFVLHMVEDTVLKYKSIETYVWGMRTWMRAQHQPDPIRGLEEWDDFMASVKVG